jgi:hypothetical protein
MLIPVGILLVLGSKATSLIINSTSPLTLLQQLSQAFPKYATALARRVEVPAAELLEELNINRYSLPAGFNGLWINGLQINDHDVNPFGWVPRFRPKILAMLRCFQFHFALVEVFQMRIFMLRAKILLISYAVERHLYLMHIVTLELT